MQKKIESVKNLIQFDLLKIIRNCWSLKEHLNEKDMHACNRLETTIVKIKLLTRSFHEHEVFHFMPKDIFIVDVYFQENFEYQHL